MSVEDFLEARIDEDQQAALACARMYPVPWEVSDRGHSAAVIADKPNFPHVVDVDQGLLPQGEDWLSTPLEHIVRWDPSRVIAHCAVRRAIVANARAASKAMGSAPAAEQISASDGPAASYWRGQDWVLRQLASLYADHPDYNPSWSPR